MTSSDITPSSSRATGALLACLSLAMLLPSLGTSIANVGLPAMAQAFNAPFHDVQWVVLAYLLAITTLIVSVGRLGDLIGRRRLMLMGIGLFTIASIASGLASSLWPLVAARAAQGLGAAIMMALTMAFVGDTVPKERAGSVMGLLGTMSAIGTALGPTLGGLLIAGQGWRAIFLVNVPLGVLAFGLAVVYLPADPAPSKGERVRFDSRGTVALALTLAAYAMAMTMGRGSVGALNAALLAAALAGAALFVWMQSRTAYPLIRPVMLRNPVLSAGLVMSVLVATVMMATLVVGPFYLSGGLGLDAARVGLVMSCGPIVAALTGVPAGRCVDRYGAQPVLLIGLVAIIAGSVLLPITSVRFGVAGYIGALTTMTAGFALFQTANNTSVMADVGRDQRGAISGLLNLSRNLGFITGASAMGAVFAAGAGAADLLAAPPEALASGLRTAFWVAAGLVLLALGVALRFRTTPCPQG
ncbi:MFS transporter [Achromobacter seleniivolatilans]|uniref:MFS transporter n=1 Tax=Achromobacter seleniivolatilans TaxID=3047478 RepID=A0ABY9M1B7_9BURK|nr:MFS transporter [Achromobacter sp. R39]WMD19993.1 MFS transporter [Achromobacter sp. R39]